MISKNKETFKKIKVIQLNNRGFSMLELMVAFGLAAILLVGVMTTSTMTKTNTDLMHGILYRDEIVRMVQQLSSTPQTLNKTFLDTSITVNTAFRACAKPPGTAGQNPDCHNGQEYPVKLLDIAGKAATGAGPIPIGDESSPGFPLYYSVLDGSLCTDSAGNPVVTADNRCAFEVVTSFIPTCTDASNYCQDPHKIALTLQYRVRLASGGTINPLNGATLKTIVAPPAPLSYVNAMSVASGFYSN